MSLVCLTGCCCVCWLLVCVTRWSLASNDDDDDMGMHGCTYTPARTTTHTDMRCDVEPNLLLLLLLLLLAHARLWQRVSIAVMSSVCGGGSKRGSRRSMDGLGTKGGAQRGSGVCLWCHWFV